MNRNFLTIGEQYNSTDFCNANKNPYVSIAKLAQAILGSSTLLNNFTCTQDSPPDLNVTISAGEIYQLATVDATPFGSLPTDSHQILKQGVNMDALPPGTLTFAAPTTPGQSVNYLIQFQLLEQDTQSQNRSFFNASPEVVNTVRQDSVFVQALAGTPAPTDTQTTPAPTTGFVPGFVVTIAYGQTTILNSNISVYTNAPFITNILGNMLTQTQANALYAQLTVSNIFTQPQSIPSITASAYLSSPFSLTGGNTPVIVPFDTVEFSENITYSTTNHNFVSAKSGYYRVPGRLFAQVNTTGANFYMTTYKNGAPYKRLDENTWNGNNLTIFGSCVIYLAVTDVVALYAANDAAGPINVGGALTNNSFEIEYIGT